MPKMKTNRAAAKRFKKTPSGRVKRGAAYRRHLLTAKTRTRKRQLRRPMAVDATRMRDMDRLLPNG